MMKTAEMKAAAIRMGEHTGAAMAKIKNPDDDDRAFKEMLELLASMAYGVALLLERAGIEIE